MKNIFKIFVLVLTLATSLSAQQENHYTMFMYNRLMYNPAFAGAREVGSISGLYRGQWYSFPGAPSSQRISFDTPVGAAKRVGIGATLSHHKIGVQRDYLASLSYSYGLIQTNTTSLKLGLMGSVLNYNYDFTNPDLLITDGVVNDPSLSNANRSFNQGNFGAGVYFNYKKMYIGASVPNLLQNKLADIANTATQQRHIYFMMGGIVPMTKSLDLRPSLMARFVKNAPISFDANASVMYNKKVTLGLSYRTDSQIKAESLDALAFFQVSNQLGIGFAYDFTLSKLQKYNNGSLEAMIRYDFGRSNESARDVFDNPRFFF